MRGHRVARRGADGVAVSVDLVLNWTVVELKAGSPTRGRLDGEGLQRHRRTALGAQRSSARAATRCGMAKATVRTVAAQAGCPVEAAGQATAVAGEAKRGRRGVSGGCQLEARQLG